MGRPERSGIHPADRRPLTPVLLPACLAVPAGLKVDAPSRFNPAPPMRRVPPSVAAFLAGRRIVVAGVSRSGRQPSNAIFRRLRAAGHEVIPVNPRASQVEGVTCHPDLASVPGTIDGLVVATPPAAAADLVRQAAARGVGRIWFHRSFGAGSVAEDALRACADAGIEPIVGGCPLMYCAPVDLAHRCFRWWLARRGRIPV